MRIDFYIGQELACHPRIVGLYIAVGIGLIGQHAERQTIKGIFTSTEFRYRRTATSNDFAVDVRVRT